MDHDRGMSVKQELRAYIEALSDEEARSLWDRIRCDDYEWSKREPLSAEDMAMIEESLADLAAGRYYTHDEVRQMFGLAGTTGR